MNGENIMLKKIVLSGLLACIAIGPVLVNAANSTTTEKVKALYILSPLIKTMAIEVITNNHNVTLIGTVDTDMQYEEAISLAQSVEGVTDVNANKLMVKASKATLVDNFITAKAKGTIMKKKSFSNQSIQYWPVTIETKDGIVYLSGKVDTEDQRENIIKLIKKIKGVKSVNSVITVKLL